MNEIIEINPDYENTKLNFVFPGESIDLSFLIKLRNRINFKIGIFLLKFNWKLKIVFRDKTGNYSILSSNPKITSTYIIISKKIYIPKHRILSIHLF